MRPLPFFISGLLQPFICLARKPNVIIRFDQHKKVRGEIMFQRCVRLSMFAAAVTVFFAFTGCQSSGTNVTTANNVNSNAGNANVQPSTKNDEQEISDLLDRYNDALLKKDAEALDRIWADDLSFVNLRGELLSKKQRIDNIKTGATELKSAEVSQKSVRLYGTSAVATLVVKVNGQYSGEQGSGEFRITTVWAKPKGTWQMVAVQMTPIAK
jgi:uncharacterized protein (TIGR02246 family)